MKDERTRLDGWKQIAGYLGRDVTTVLRWEKRKKLPVRRLPGGKRQVVFAYQEELDHWLVATTGNGIPNREPTNSGNDRSKPEASPADTGSGDHPLSASAQGNGKNRRCTDAGLELSHAANGSAEANSKISVSSGPELRNSVGIEEPKRRLGLSWDFLRRYRPWLLAISSISAIVPVADVLLAHPHGIQMLRDVIAGGLASATFYLYRWSTTRSRT